MIRIQDIQDALLHLVGWEQSYDPQQQIDEKLTESESGLTYQQAHPMCTLENIKAIMPEQYMYQYPEWKVTEEYAKGVKVSYQLKVWESLQNHYEGNTPAEG